MNRVLTNRKFSRMNNKHLFIKAELQQTAEKKTPKIHGLAYAGGLIDVGFEHSVVIDLQGLEISPNLPLSKYNLKACKSAE